MPKKHYPPAPAPAAGKTAAFPTGETFNLAPAGNGYVLLELTDTTGNTLSVEIEDVRVPEVFVWAIACTGYTPDALMRKHRAPGTAFSANTHPKTRPPAEPETFTDRFGDTLTISHVAPNKLRFAISSDQETVQVVFADVLLVPLFTAGAEATGLTPGQITQKALDTGVLTPSTVMKNRATRRAQKRKPVSTW